MPVHRAARSRSPGVNREKWSDIIHDQRSYDDGTHGAEKESAAQNTETDGRDGDVEQQRGETDRAAEQVIEDECDTVDSHHREIGCRSKIVRSQSDEYAAEHIDE